MTGTNQFSDDSFTKQFDSAKDVILQKLGDGVSKYDIAKEYGCSYGALYRWMKLRGIFIDTRGKSKLYDETNNKVRTKFKLEFEELSKLYWDDELNLNEIASMYGVTAATVLNRMKKFGIPRRDKSKASKVLYRKKPELREVHRANANVGKTGIFAGNDYKDTWIETCFAKWCDAHNIEYISQYQLHDCGHRYDFYLPEYNLIVEMDGVYWHSSEKQKLKDRLFETEAVLAGHEITRITDKELKRHNVGVFECILKKNWKNFPMKN